MVELVGTIFFAVMIALIVVCIRLRLREMFCPDTDGDKPLILKKGDVPLPLCCGLENQCFYCLWAEVWARQGCNCRFPCAQRDYKKFDENHFKLSKERADALGNDYWAHKVDVFYIGYKRYVSFDSPHMLDVVAFPVPKKND